MSPTPIWLVSRKRRREPGHRRAGRAPHDERRQRPGWRAYKPRRPKTASESPEVREGGWGSFSIAAFGKSQSWGAFISVLWPPELRETKLLPFKPPGLWCWASLVAQLVKNPPAMRETQVRSLGWEDPLEKGKATHSRSMVLVLAAGADQSQGMGVGDGDWIRGPHPKAGHSVTRSAGEWRGRKHPQRNQSRCGQHKPDFRLPLWGEILWDENCV